MKRKCLLKTNFSYQESTTVGHCNKACVGILTIMTNYLQQKATFLSRVHFCLKIAINSISFLYYKWLRSWKSNKKQHKPIRANFSIKAAFPHQRLSKNGHVRISNFQYLFFIPINVKLSRFSRNLPSVRPVSHVQHKISRKSRFWIFVKM